MHFSRRGARKSTSSAQRTSRRQKGKKPVLDEPEENDYLAKGRGKEKKAGILHQAHPRKNVRRLSTSRGRGEKNVFEKRKKREKKAEKSPR